MEIRKVDAGQGWRWIADGFGLFRKNPLIWIVLFVIYLLILMLFTIIPVVGPLIMSVLAPVFAAGFMLACRDLENGSELELRYLIAGFMHNTGQLVTVGGLYLIGSIIIMAAVVPFSARRRSTVCTAESRRTWLSAPWAGCWWPCWWR